MIIIDQELEIFIVIFVVVDKSCFNLKKTATYIYFRVLYTGRGLAVNFCKKCGEMRWKKNNFHRVFFTSFGGQCGESR